MQTLLTQDILNAYYSRIENIDLSAFEDGIYFLDVIEKGQTHS